MMTEWLYIGFTRLVIALAVIVATVIYHPVQSVAAPPMEQQIEAAMIFNMIRFVEWPESWMRPESDNLVICTAGNGNMSQALQNLSYKTLKGRNIQIKQAGRQSDLSKCQVLFIGEMSRAATHAYIEASRKGAVLTISDTKGFVEWGGMIGFIIHKGKVSFEINQQSTAKQGIRISSRLLKLAHRVLGSQ